jgi:malonate transporter
MLSVLADPILPIFLTLILGYVFRRTGLFDALAAQAINRFVFYLAMPALIFNLIAHVPLREIDLPAVGVYLAAELLVYALVAWVAYRVFKRSAGESLLIGMAAAFVNHLLFVLPIAQHVYGASAAQPITAIVLVDALVFCATVLLTDLIQARAAHRAGQSDQAGQAGQPSQPGQPGQPDQPGQPGQPIRHGPLAVLRLLAKNPFLIGSVLGLLATGVLDSIPSGVFTYAGFVGSAAAPASLFALGVILAGQPLLPIGAPTGLVVVAKLLLHPGLVFVLGGLVTMKPGWDQMAFLVAAGPCGAMPFVIALQYGIKPEVIAKAVLVSTALSLFSLGLLTAA